MTCIRFAGGIICVNSWGRLHIGNRYIWVDFHEYLGPTFWIDQYMNKQYEPKDENDPAWGAFGKWHDKYRAKKARRDAQLQANRAPAQEPGEQKGQSNGN